MKKRYVVRYFIEENLVSEEYFDDKNNAIETAEAFDCEAFNGANMEKYSLYVEARDTETWNILIWLNTDGERGTDYEDINVWDTT